MDGGEAPVPDARRALFGLRIALAFFAGGALIGGPSDMVYHMQTPFESFFSPPHLFIYGMTAAAIAVVCAIAAKGELREAFGASRRIPLLPWSVPGGLLFLGGGLVVLLLSGVLDEVWHGAFGVDETRFSVPHAMFGWGLFATTLGFTSARDALRKTAPVGRAEALFFAFLFLSFSAYAFLLPFLVYPTEGTVRAIAGLPVIQSQPAAAHTFRIYEAWDINRAGFLFMPLAAVWAGVAYRGLAFFKSGTGFTILAAAAASAAYTVLWYAFAVRLGTQADPAAWLPIPLVAPVGLMALGKPAKRSYGELQAGAAFAALTLVIWPPLGSTIFAYAVILRFVAGTIAFVGGLGIGLRVMGAVRRPDRDSPLFFVGLLGVAAPLAFGILDFVMRWTTP